MLVLPPSSNYPSDPWNKVFHSSVNTRRLTTKMSPIRHQAYQDMDITLTLPNKVTIIYREATSRVIIARICFCGLIPTSTKLGSFYFQFRVGLPTLRH